MAQGKRGFGRSFASTVQTIGRLAGLGRTLVLDRLRVFCCAALVLLACGCEPDFVGAPSFTDVQGRVLLDGQPVESAKVIFIPLAADIAPESDGMGYGITDAQGNFSLTRANGESGICRGIHRVFISKRVEGEGNVSSVQVVDLEPAELDSILMQPEEVDNMLRQPTNEVIPTIYNIHSQLEFEVDSTLGLVRANFDLSSVDPAITDSKD